MVTNLHRYRFVVLAAIAAAFSLWGAARSQADVADLTVVGSPDAVSVLDAATGEVTARVPGGVASPDGQVVVRATRSDGRTTLIAVDPGSGEQRWRREVAGLWDIRLVGVDGQTVVLGAPDGQDLYTPVPRSRTVLLVSRPDGEPRRYDLAGNYEPEALTVDGQSVFVISYLPPLAPDRYQVRRLDLRSGEVVDVFTPDAHLQEAMGGTARTQVWAPDGRRLYTLYTLAEPDGEKAFVHVLDLEDLWAHCIDLPDGVATTDEAAVAMALGSHERLYVADRAGGTLAELDVDALTVARTAALTRAPFAEATAAVAPDGRLLLAAGRRVDVVEPDSLQTVGAWRLDGDIVGLRVDRTGREVIAVLRDRGVVVLDATSGEHVRGFTLRGTQPVDSVGSSAKRVPSPRQGVDCAC